MQEMTAHEPSRAQAESPSPQHHAIDEQTQDLKLNEEANDPPTTMQYANLKSASFILILVALSFSVFCVALDNIIIATAIPRITDEFHSINDIAWYGSGYLLPTCAFQLLSGKLYTRYSAKWIFLGALFIFEVGSLLSAVAPSSVAFIVGRAISGVGAAALFTGSLVIVATLVPPEKAPAFQSINAGTFGIASAVAPVINLPIGAVSAILVIFLLKIQAPKHEPLTIARTVWQLDPLGITFFLASIVTLLLALQWGGIEYPWSNYRVIIVLVFFAVLFVAFVVDQYFMGDNANIPGRFAKQRTVAAVAWVNIFLFGSFNTAFYFIPIYFQGVKNESAEGSGIRTIPLVVVQVVIIVITGILSAKTGHYVPFFIASVALASVGVGLLTTWQVDSSNGVLVGYQVIVGFGFGMGLQLFATAISAALPDEDIPTGMALATMAQFFGASVFLGAGNNVFETKLIENVNALHIPGIDGHTVASAGATIIRDLVPPQYLASVIDAYMEALRWTFRISLILVTLAIFGAVGMEWKRVRGHGAGDKLSTEPEGLAEEPKSS